jgi:dTDP-4-dehydrorhamnose reductase
MRILVTGASGYLGGYLLHELSRHPVPAVAWSGSQTGARLGIPLQTVDLENPDAVAGAFRTSRPTVVIHAAALASVAACFGHPERAHRINVDASKLLAELAEQAGARLLHVSTDLVFDGTRGGYREDDAVAPLSVYGRSKAAAEQAVLATPGSAVVRVSLLFGPARAGRPSFFDEQIAALRAGRACTLFEDEWRTPLALTTAARALLTIARSDFSGVLHLGGPERVSRLEMGRRLAAFLGADPSVIRPARRNHVAALEPRPCDTSLDSSHWRQLFPEQSWPAWNDALREMVVS